MSQILPRDFYSEQPPERIMGSECEYNVKEHARFGERLQHLANIGYITVDGQTLRLFSSAKHSNLPDMWLGNGGRIYRDVGHVEYAGPECFGPYEAACADLAGARIMRRITQLTGSQEAFRRTGFNFGDRYTPNPSDKHTQKDTSGYHLNFTTPNESLYELFRSPLLASFLASCVFSFGGMVTPTGYNLSQKADGIGEEPVFFGRATSITTHSKKPMAFFRTDSDDKLVSKTGWGIVEVRLADAGQLPWARFETFGMISALIRLVEHQDKLPNINGLMLQDAVASAKAISKDIYFMDTHLTRSGKRIKTLELVGVFIEQLDLLRDKEIAQLPTTELLAIEEARNGIELLKKNPINNGELDPTKSSFDFAARHYYMEQYLARHPEYESTISARNPDAQHFDLVCDLVEPKGIIERIADRSDDENNILKKSDILHAIANAPKKTRAKTRGAAVKADPRPQKVNWVSVTDHSGNKQWLENPYLWQPSK